MPIINLNQSYNLRFNNIEEKFYEQNSFKSKGFTLIEVLVVVVIMGMLIGLIGPNVLGQADRARVTTAKTQIATLSQALDMYKPDNHFYPTTDQALTLLLSSQVVLPFQEIGTLMAISKVLRFHWIHGTVNLFI